MCLHGSLAAAKVYFKTFQVTTAQIKRLRAHKLAPKQINEEQIRLCVTPETVNKSLPSLHEVGEMLGPIPSVYPRHSNIFSW